MTIKQGKRIAFWAGVAAAVFKAMHALGLVFVFNTVAFVPVPAEPDFGGWPVANQSQVNAIVATASQVNVLPVR